MSERKKIDSNFELEEEELNEVAGGMYKNTPGQQAHLMKCPNCDYKRIVASLTGEMKCPKCNIRLVEGILY